MKLAVNSKRAIESKEIDRLMHETLGRINKAYIPGCVQYWDNKNPNAWQSAFDQMESAYKNGGIGFVKAKINWFEKTILDLILIYENLNPEAKNKINGNKLG